MLGGQFSERTEEEHAACEEHWRAESTAAGNPAGLIPCASSKETAQSFLMITLRCIGKVLLMFCDATSYKWDISQPVLYSYIHEHWSHLFGAVIQLGVIDAKTCF